MQLIINQGEKVDNIGSVLEYKNEKDYGINGYNHIPMDLVSSIIQDINFPLHWVDIPIFLFPYRLMRYTDYWEGTQYNGRAYPTHIIYGARREIPSKESIGALIVHELGHALCYKFVDENFRDYTFTDKFKEYMEIRGINGWTDKAIWEKRPSEVWAEDFRYLFGSDYMREEEFLPYKHIEPPGEEIRKFMVDLVGGEDLRRFKQYTVEEYLDFLRKLIITRNINEVHLHHTWKPTKEDYNLAASKESVIYGMWAYHTENLGWADIGQHISLATDGTVWDGRDINTTPASISGHNAGAFAIEMIGNFDIGFDKLEGKQLESLIKLLKGLFEIFSDAKLVFHREFSDKTCPGTSIDKEEVLLMVSNQSNITDIKGHWAEEDIELVIQEGLMTGYPDKTFKPDQTLTRAELATVLANQIKAKAE